MVEFQAVILAAGSGSRMYPLTDKIPKALLHVGNLPLIWYPVNTLEKAGFEEIIVVVLESEAQQISQALSTYCSNTKLKFDFSTIPDDKDMGTADSLRQIKDKIEKDVVLVSCDLITDVSLHHLADIHRTYDSSVTALLAPIPETNADREAAANPKMKKKKNHNLDQCDYVGIHSPENRLIFFAPGADLEETLVVRKSLLKRYPCINVVTNLMDGHLYIMKKWVIDYLAQNNSISTVKGELVPHLVKKQFQSQKKKANKYLFAADTSSVSVVGDDSKPDLLSFAIEDDITRATRGFSTWSSSCITENGHGNSIRCHTYVMDSGLCLRANTLPMYMEANRLIPKQLGNLTKEISLHLIHPSAVIKPKSQVGGDCMVDESVSVGEKVSIKKSVIGKHTTIGDRVKITNSVIMDHVTIKDGCNIQNSIICNNAYIKENATIKDCQVGNGFTVNEGGEFKGEALVTEQLMDFE